MAGEEDEVISSECISGSQSGWTSYLNHSSCNTPLLLVHNNGHSSSQEQEEDLSMVSDASSKPPHFHVEEDEQYCNCSPWLKQDGGKKRRLEPKQGKDHLSSLLDDTASSKEVKPPMEEGVLEISSCNFSATHFKINHALEKHKGARTLSGKGRKN